MHRNKHAPLLSPCALHIIGVFLLKTLDMVWSASQGLWKGTYGAHGLEVVHAQVCRSQLVFTKITGDCDTPAGWMTLMVRPLWALDCWQSNQCSIPGKL